MPEPIQGLPPGAQLKPISGLPAGAELRPVNQDQPHSNYIPTGSKPTEPPQTMAQQIGGFGKDLGKGVLESVGGAFDTIGAPAGMLAHKLGLVQETPEQRQQQEQLFKPTNWTQAIGAGAGDAAQAMVPVEKALPYLGKALEMLPIPTRAKAGKLFEQAMKLAGDEPVRLSNTMEPLTEAQALMKSGGGSNTPIRDLVNRLNEFDSGPLTYQQARRFAPNIARTSVSDTLGMSPTLQRQVGTVSHAFNEDVANAAARRGAGDIHAKAMSTYAKAARNSEIAGAIGNKAKKVLPYVAYPAGGYLGYRAAKELIPQ